MSPPGTRLLAIARLWFDESTVEVCFEALVADPRLLPPPWPRWVEEEGAERAVCDYIAGMTDREALQEYQRIFRADTPPGIE